MWSNAFGAAARARHAGFTKHPLFHGEAAWNTAIHAAIAVQLSLDGASCVAVWGSGATWVWEGGDVDRSATICTSTADTATVSAGS